MRLYYVVSLSNINSNNILFCYTIPNPIYYFNRAATIKAASVGQLWAMDRQTFRRILLKSAFKKRKMYETLLDNVPMLKALQVCYFVIIIIEFLLFSNLHNHKKISIQIAFNIIFLERQNSHLKIATTTQFDLI